MVDPAQDAIEHLRAKINDPNLFITQEKYNEMQEALKAGYELQKASPEEMQEALETFENVTCGNNVKNLMDILDSLIAFQMTSLNKAVKASYADDVVA